VQFISAGEFGTASDRSDGITAYSEADAARELSYANSTDLLKEILTFKPGFASQSVSFA
jgi:hypothetical protein